LYRSLTLWWVYCNTHSKFSVLRGHGTTFAVFYLLHLYRQAFVVALITQVFLALLKRFMSLWVRRRSVSLYPSIQPTIHGCLDHSACLASYWLSASSRRDYRRSPGLIGWPIVPQTPLPGQCQLACGISSSSCVALVTHVAYTFGAVWKKWNMFVLDNQGGSVGSDRVE
jgi:hypothetical protein